MASVDLGLRHYGDATDANFGHAMCGVPVLHPRTQLSENIDYVTCEDCAIRLVAELHRQTSVLLKTLAGRIVALRAAAESAVKRD